MVYEARERERGRDRNGFHVKEMKRAKENQSKLVAERVFAFAFLCRGFRPDRCMDVCKRERDTLRALARTTTLVSKKGKKAK